MLLHPSSAPTDFIKDHVVHFTFFRLLPVLTLNPYLGYESTPSRAKTAKSIFDIRDPVAHAPVRRMWDSAFGRAALSDYEVPLVARVNQLADALADDASKKGVVDLSDWIKRFS